MTKADIERLEEMRHEGVSVRVISQRLNVPLESVRTYCKRHPIEDSDKFCPVCNKRLVHMAHKRKKRFCSESCRRTWWKAHPEAVKRKKHYQYACKSCGDCFNTYRQNAKFCSLNCYNEFRRREGEAWQTSLQSV